MSAAVSEAASVARRYVRQGASSWPRALPAFNVSLNEKMDGNPAFFSSALPMPHGHTTARGPNSKTSTAKRRETLTTRMVDLLGCFLWTRAV